MQFAFVTTGNFVILVIFFVVNFVILVILVHWGFFFRQFYDFGDFFFCLSQTKSENSRKIAKFTKVGKLT